MLKITHPCNGILKYTRERFTHTVKCLESMHAMNPRSGAVDKTRKLVLYHRILANLLASAEGTGHTPGARRKHDRSV
jgi:hypothetical protein